jgi:hypothetical protein
MARSFSSSEPLSETVAIESSAMQIAPLPLAMTA